MFKPTPNPPDTDPASPYENLDSKNCMEPPSARLISTSLRRRS